MTWLLMKSSSSPQIGNLIAYEPADPLGGNPELKKLERIAERDPRGYYKIYSLSQDMMCNFRASKIPGQGWEWKD